MKNGRSVFYLKYFLLLHIMVVEMIELEFTTLPAISYIRCCGCVSLLFKKLFEFLHHFWPINPILSWFLKILFFDNTRNLR